VTDQQQSDQQQSDQEQFRQRNGSGPEGGAEGTEEQGPVVRDKRRIDPETGALREPAETPAPAGAPAGEAAGESEGLKAQLAERTADLQRLSAEYANYRRRVERDNALAGEMAVGNVLTSLLPVLDDIGRARDHGELEGGFKAVAESLIGVVTKLGLEQYGKAGEPFDPQVHEALMHQHADDVTEPTCVQVLQPGYRLGERILRPARVAVADPDA
jgi:molecular chaperone GrpE